MTKEIKVINLTDEENLEEAYLEETKEELRKAGLKFGSGSYIFVPQKKWYNFLHNMVSEAQFKQWAVGRFVMEVFDKKNIDKYKKILSKSKFDWRINVT